MEEQLNDTHLTIGETAQALHISTHTLRYYERAGLLGVPRAAGLHRRYSERELEKLRFLLRLRATGMPVKSIRRYVELADQGDHTRDERTALLLSHRTAVFEQLRQLQNDLAAIEHKLRDHYQAAALLNIGGTSWTM